MPSSSPPSPPSFLRGSSESSHESWTPDRHNQCETYWVKLQTWFKERGYMFRPRFREDWVASWKGTDKFYWKFEDGQVHSSLTVIDATRILDGAPVMLKSVAKPVHPHEVEISRDLSSEPHASDPRNHCVTIHEVLQVPDGFDNGEGSEEILVMPLLRQYDDPRFDTVGEAVSFFSQIFEGLQFLHSLNIAHRDCNSSNIMMDAKYMYPNSWHPVETDREPNFKRKAKHFTRTAKPVKYYFIDFGHSRRYKAEERPPMEPIIRGGDKSPPEHRIRGKSCDPFPTDVYFLGNIIRKEFIEEKSGFDFMKSLADDMTNEDPAKRPNIDEVMTRFKAIQKSLSSWQLRSRVIYRKDFAIVAPFRIVPHWARRVRYIITRTPAIPSPRS